MVRARFYRGDRVAGRSGGTGGAAPAVVVDPGTLSDPSRPVRLGHLRDRRISERDPAAGGAVAAGHDGSRPPPPDLRRNAFPPPRAAPRLSDEPHSTPSSGRPPVRGPVRYLPPSAT